MEVILAKSAGFCFGVKRAIDVVYAQIEDSSSHRIYTYGPIIHNKVVIKDLEKKGVQVIEDMETMDWTGEEVVIIRSHGVRESVYDYLKQQGVKIVDATCPFVKKIHDIVRKEKEKGKHIIIIGNKDHPEVEGICGWAKEGYTVIESCDEARDFRLDSAAQKICIVSQTTFNYIKFKELVEILSKMGYDTTTVNTICNATKERQEEALEVAKEVDAMLVIGDRHSSNTQKLYNLCSDVCKRTFYIQTRDDLASCELASVERLGITAGASTPNKIIEEVQRNVRVNF